MTTTGTTGTWEKDAVTGGFIVDLFTDPGRSSHGVCIVPAGHVERARATGGGGYAVCEACGRIVYVPPSTTVPR